MHRANPSNSQILPAQSRASHGQKPLDASSIVAGQWTRTGPIYLDFDRCSRILPFARLIRKGICLADSSIRQLPVRCQAQRCSRGQTGAEMSIPNDQLLPVGEVAKRLAVSVFTVRRLIRARLLKAVSVARRVLVPASEVDRVISEGCGVPRQ